MQKLNLNFLERSPKELVQIYKEIIALVRREYDNAIAIIAIGSIVKGNFSYDSRQERKTLSDVELVIISPIKIGQSKLNIISELVGSRWFKDSELFHIDIRESTEKELLNRSNLLPFQQTEVVLGDFDKTAIANLASISHFPLADILEKNIYQYSLFKTLHKNQGVSAYILLKLAIEIVESGLINHGNVKKIGDIETFKKVKSNLLIDSLTEMDIKRSKELINLALTMVQKNTYFSIKQLECMLDDCIAYGDVFSESAFGGFVDYYYSDENPQIEYFTNIYNIGRARAAD